MNTNYLEYFVTLYRVRNMHKAAEELYISQQGLSRIIQSLEKEWGVALFERSNQGMEPTKAGDYFYEKALVLQNELLNARRDFQVLKEGKREIRIALAYSTLYKFYPLMEHFRQENPDIQIRWFEVSERIAKRMLLSKEVDAAVLTAAEGNDPLIYRPIFTHEQYLLVYEGHPLYNCEKIHHSMLADEVLIMESSDRQMITHFNHACMKEGFLPNCMVQSPDITFCHRLCSQGEGLVVTLDIGYENLNFPNVRMIPFAENGYVSQVHFAKRNQFGRDVDALEKACLTSLNHRNHWKQKIEE